MTQRIPVWRGKPSPAECQIHDTNYSLVTVDGIPCGTDNLLACALIDRLRYSVKEIRNDTNHKTQRTQLTTPQMTVLSNCHRRTYIAEIELNS